MVQVSFVFFVMFSDHTGKDSFGERTADCVQITRGSENATCTGQRATNVTFRTELQTLTSSSIKRGCDRRFDCTIRSRDELSENEQETENDVRAGFAAINPPPFTLPPPLSAAIALGSIDFRRYIHPFRCQLKSSVFERTEQPSLSELRPLPLLRYPG